MQALPQPAAGRGRSGRRGLSVETEFAQRFDAVEARIEAACRRAGRARDTVELIAVSKRHPIAAIEAVAALGQRAFGENQVQEAAGKIPELPSTLEWHSIGPLQSNKVAAAARLFDVFHAVDRAKIARLLAKRGARRDRPIEAFLQVRLGGEATKHGFDPEQFEAECRPLFSLGGLRIRGLMTIPPPADDPEDTRPHFARLRALRDLAATWPEAAGWRGDLSMGMSHDLEVAIEEGATLVRVGTDLFGPRAT